MTTDERRRLVAVRDELNDLLADITTAPAPPATTTTSEIGGFGARPGRKTADCQHPRAKREDISGFGKGPKQWRCGECGHQDTNPEEV